MRRRDTIPTWRAAVLAILVLFYPAMSIANPLALSAIGKFTLPGGAPTGLSGLTYAGGNQFYAVEDSGARMYPLTISIHSVSGAINSASVGSLVQLTGTDLEGIAYNATNNSVYVSDETGPGIREYNLAGTLIGSVAVPPIYNNIRTNLSLESLSVQAGFPSIWTANEQALTVDGSTSSTSSGTTVRLQRFDSLLSPDGQWAYETDAVSNSFPSASSEQVGVSDLLALPNGKVLVLERQADAFIDVSTPSLRYKNRIYEVDFSIATDVSGLAGLAGEELVPVTKTLLWDSPWFTEGDRDNFEGMTLGPQLDNGDFSLLLISDGDDSAGFAHGESLYALRLSGDLNLPGDANGDGVVDLLDLDILGTNFGTSPADFSQGDFNGDNVVDLLDLDILGSHFGAMTVMAMSQSVPEPTTVVLTGLMVGLTFGCTRRSC